MGWKARAGLSLRPGCLDRSAGPERKGRPANIQAVPQRTGVEHPSNIILEVLQEIIQVETLPDNMLGDPHPKIIQGDPHLIIALVVLRLVEKPHVVIEIQVLVVPKIGPKWQKCGPDKDKTSMVVHGGRHDLDRTLHVETLLLCLTRDNM